MQEHVVDRTGWGAGPWDKEPDRIEWRDEATGLPCLIVRGPVGALCGYVGVPPTHPWHGISYSGCTQRPTCGESYCEHSPGVDVHGGLTYSGRCRGSICHVPAPGEEDNVWWFGFDCAHSGDYTPRSRDYFAAMFDGHGSADDAYRTVAYVRNEVTSLASQIAAAK